MTLHQFAFFTPFGTLTLLLMQCTQCLPLREGTSNSTNTTLLIQNIDPPSIDDNSQENSSFITFLEQRDLVEQQVDPESLEYDDTFSVKHISALQSLFETGSHFFDPFVNFIQSLAEGVKGSPAPLAAAQPPRDKRMLYIV